MLRAKLRLLEKPDGLKAFESVERFNMAYFESYEMFDHMYSLCELYLVQKCDHLSDEGHNTFPDSMRSI